MSEVRRLRGLYAITPETADTERLLVSVSAALAGGAALVQYRSKSFDQALRLSQAKGIRALCHERAVPLIINDDVRLAELSDADGVHLGRNDCDFREARNALGPDRVIGVSCYADVSLALAAQKVGADYVAFGSFFASSTKPAAKRASLTTLAEARSKLRIPIAVIGGITPENASPLVAAGADLLAVISGLFDAPDIASAARKFSNFYMTNHV